MQSRAALDDALAAGRVLEATRVARSPLSLVQASSLFTPTVSPDILLQAYLGHACSDTDRQRPGS